MNLCRRKSMIDAIANAANEDPQIDGETQQGPKIMIFSNRKKILPPLRDDYHKEETFWTGSKFR